MKKRYLLLIYTLVLTLTGCDKLKELATIRINTKIETEIPIVIAANLPAGAAFGENIHIPLTFSETHIIKLQDNFDIEPYLKKIKEIDLGSVEITALGMQPGEVINSVTLEVDGISHILTLTNISATNNTFKPAIPQSLLDAVSNKFLKEEKITVTVYGSANSAMSISVGVSIEAGIIAYVLN